jgi:AcrR family transcriptional regulator
MVELSLQEARQAVVRERVLAGVAEVLAAGHDLTFARVAGAAGVPERTVYRHFPTRQDLLTAVVEWVNQRTGAQRATTGDEAAELVRRVFPTFDQMAPVIRELLTAAEGLPARLADNDERRRAALAVVRHDAEGLDPATARRVAAVIQLLTSAAAWQTLRDFWEMDGTEAAEAVAVAIDLLLAGARTHTNERSAMADARVTGAEASPQKEGPR